MCKNCWGIDIFRLNTCIKKRRKSRENAISQLRNCSTSHIAVKHSSNKNCQHQQRDQILPSSKPLDAAFFYLLSSFLCIWGRSSHPNNAHAQCLKITKNVAFLIFLPKWTIIGIFDELLSTQNVNVARFAHSVKWDFSMIS